MRRGFPKRHSVTVSTEARYFHKYSEVRDLQKTVFFSRPYKPTKGSHYDDNYLDFRCLHLKGASLLTVTAQRPSTLPIPQRKVDSKFCLHLSHGLHNLEKQRGRRLHSASGGLPPLLPRQRRGRMERISRAEGLPADGAGVRQQSGYGSGRRAVALAGGGGVEGTVALQGAGGGASALDDGGVRPAGGDAVRNKGYPAGNRRLFARGSLRPLGGMELRVFPKGGKCLRLPMVSRFYGFHQA